MQFQKSKLEPITIELGGEKYPARLPFKALAELEELTKMSFMTLFDKFATASFTSNDLINILYIALKYGGVEVEIDDLQEMEISSEVLRTVMDEIANLLKRTQKVVSQIQDHQKPDKKK